MMSNLQYMSNKNKILHLTMLKTNPKKENIYFPVLFTYRFCSITTNAEGSFKITLQNLPYLGFSVIWVFLFTSVVM